MDSKTFFDQLLQAGRELATQGRDLASRGVDIAEQRLGLPEEGPERDAALSTLGKGAVAGGVLALLLGTGSGRMTRCVKKTIHTAQAATLSFCGE